MYLMTPEVILTLFCIATIVQLSEAERTSLPKLCSDPERRFFEMHQIEANLSIREAARLIGVAAPTVRKWIRERRIGFTRCGRRVVLAPSDVQRFLAAGRVEPRRAEEG